MYNPAEISRLLLALKSNFSPQRAIELLKCHALKTNQAQEILQLGRSSHVAVYKHYFQFLASKGEWEIIEAESVALQNKTQLYLKLCTTISNCLVEAQAVSGKVLAALDTKKQMNAKLTANTYIALLRSMTQDAMTHDRCALVIEEMCNEKIHVSAEFCAEIAAELGRLSLVSALDHLFRLMRVNDRDIDTITYHAFVHEYARTHDGNIDEGMQIVEKVGGLKRDVVAYTMLVDAYARLGRMSEIEGVMKLMEKKECSPNSTIFNIILTAYGKCGDFEQVLGWVKIMEKYNLQPSLTSFQPLLKYYFEKRDLSKYGEVMDFMKSKGVTLFGRKHINLIFSFLEELEGSPPVHVLIKNKKVYTSDKMYISALKWLSGINKNIKDCEMLVEDMLENGEYFTQEMEKLVQNILGISIGQLVNRLRKKNMKPSSSSVLSSNSSPSSLASSSLSSSSTSSPSPTSPSTSPYSPTLSSDQSNTNTTKTKLHTTSLHRTDVTPQQFNTALEVLIAKENFDTCMILLKEMETRGIKPDVNLFNSIVSEYTSRMKVLQAIRDRIVT